MSYKRLKYFVLILNGNAMNRTFYGSKSRKNYDAKMFYYYLLSQNGAQQFWLTLIHPVLWFSQGTFNMIGRL